MGKPEIEAFLTDLTVEEQVAASTQNQALSALLFLYREVLDIEVVGVDGLRPESIALDKGERQGVGRKAKSGRARNSALEN